MKMILVNLKKININVFLSILITALIITGCSSGVSDLNGTTWSSDDKKQIVEFQTKTLVLVNGRAGKYKVEDNIVIIDFGVFTIPLTYEEDKLSGKFYTNVDAKIITLTKITESQIEPAEEKRLKDSELAEEKTEKKETKNTPSIDKEFITLNSIQIGDNIGEHKNFVLSDDQDSFFDIYINKKETTINKLKGNLYLFVSNSIVEKIKFNSRDSFMGSTSVAGIAFDAMLKERKSWIRDAMLNYNINEWDDSRKTSQYVKNDYFHQYSLERIELMGMQIGWNMSYVITSKNAEIKEQQGKKSNLDFGSTKEKKEVKNNANDNKENQEEVEFIKKSKKDKKQQFLIISVDNLRVRTSPELNSEKIENLAIGSEVEFLEKSKNQTTVTIKDNEITEYWYKIKTPNGNIGWIHGCCFGKKKKDINNKI